MVSDKEIHLLKVRILYFALSYSISACNQQLVSMGLTSSGISIVPRINSADLDENRPGRSPDKSTFSWILNPRARAILSISEIALQATSNSSLFLASLRGVRTPRFESRNSKTSGETGFPPVFLRAAMCRRINTLSSSRLSLAILITEPTSFHRFSRKPKRLLSKKPAKTRGKSKRPNPLVLRFGSRFLFVSRRRFLKSDKFLQIPISPTHLVSLWLTSQYPPGVV